MNYLTWRDDIFGRPGDSDPVSVPLLPEIFELSLEEHFDHIDRALCDPDIHVLYSPEQIGIGLSQIYSPPCGDFGRCYIEAGDEARRIAGIRNLDHLYTNFFDRYCLSPVWSVGNRSDGHIGHICYMLWDIFVLNPYYASPAMADAAVDVMAKALRMTNDNCITSAIHGLGEWTCMEVPRAKETLQDWLRNPTTANPEVLAYAKQATTGRIL